MENKPANSATKAYVRRRLCISPSSKDSFSKNQFNSLVAATQRCINNKLPFDDLSAYKKLKHMSSRDVEAVQKLIKNTIEYIKKGIFQPEKYTDPKGSRFFSLLPLAQVSNRHVTLTVREIIALAIKAGVAIPRPKEDKEGKLLFHRCFYLRKAGIRLNFAARDFRYTLTTDGYSCCSFMEKRVKKKMKADAIKPSRVTAKVADSIVWGIDPGLHSVFTAVDQQGTIRTTSANEYYQRSGNTTFRNSLQRLQQQQPDDHAFVEALPTLKTSNLDDFMRSVAIRLQNLDRMRRFYAVLPKWRFKRYRSKQQTLNEMSNQLIGASRKYHPDTMQNHNVTIAFGDAGFSAKPGTRRLGGVKALRERLTADAMASRGRVLYFKTDEYLTSQVCNTCSTRTLGNIK